MRLTWNEGHDCSAKNGFDENETWRNPASVLRIIEKIVSKSEQAIHVDPSVSASLMLEHSAVRCRCECREIVLWQLNCGRTTSFGDSRLHNLNSKITAN